MTAAQKTAKVAVLDDYQNVALKMADWSVLKDRAEVTVFNDHVKNFEKLVERLSPFDIICVMRERTPLTAVLLEHLPNLKLIVSTGSGNASIDKDAAQARKIEIMNTGYVSSPTIELTWALILASARNIVVEALALQNGGWQQSVGDDIAGKTLGLVGLGKIGSKVAKIAQAFEMNVIAWSQNLTEEKATAVGARLVSKEELFKQADIVSVHLVLSDRTRGLIGTTDLGLMKPTAKLVNTSRGPIVNAQALVEAVQKHRIAGAAVDVFDEEPLPFEDQLRKTKNIICTPHIGYVTRSTYEVFYGDMVKNILTWLDK